MYVHIHLFQLRSFLFIKEDTDCDKHHKTPRVEWGTSILWVASNRGDKPRSCRWQRWCKGKDTGCVCGQNTCLLPLPPFGGFCWTAAVTYFFSCNLMRFFFESHLPVLFASLQTFHTKPLWQKAFPTHPCTHIASAGSFHSFAPGISSFDTCRLVLLLPTHTAATKISSLLLIWNQPSPWAPQLPPLFSDQTWVARLDFQDISSLIYSFLIYY